MSKIEISTNKFKMKKFNDKENFSLWQKIVKALVQHGLHKTLQGKSAKYADISDEDWEELDLSDKYDPIIFWRRGHVLCDGWKNGYGLWSRLETLYMSKNLSNKMYLKK